jgi:hexosaminidase
MDLPVFTGKRSNFYIFFFKTKEYLSCNHLYIYAFYKVHPFYFQSNTIPMPKLTVFISVFIYLLACSISHAQQASSKLPTELGIIPAPNTIQIKGINSELKTLKIANDTKQISTYAQWLVTGLKNVSWAKSNVANVIFEDQSNLKNEGYSIDIQKDKIVISAGNDKGFQYALTSLAQLVRHKGFPLPQVKISDNPKFDYRGLHLDVGRHFFSVQDIKKYLDYMAYYKYNNFHWHLTEDQGWRIEIKKYPRLQEVAAYRKETLIGNNNDRPQKFDGKRYGGFYTQEQVKEIVAYAKDRNINVIPEIEMPGHSLAALAAYPELGCENKKYEVATKWGVFEDVYCPNEKTFKFLEDVIDEVIALFPSPYIHIGGDECPKAAWKKSDFCQQLIKKEKLKDEHELQSYFIQRMEKYINSKGRKIIGWDEILEGGLAPNATVMSWRGIEGGLEAARQNHTVIMTPGSHCYFDHYQSESPDEPLAIGGYTSVEKVYHWEPIPQELETDKRKYILGGQANVWTEYIKDYPYVEYMVYARGLAMAEALWSNSKDYPAFLMRYDLHQNYWKNQGANIANHIYELSPKVEKMPGKETSMIKFILPKGSQVSCSSHDQKLLKQDAKQSFELNKTGVYTFQAINGTAKGKELRIEYNKHKALSAKIDIQPSPDRRYSGNGMYSIINGIKGSDKRFKTDEWLGFNGTDAVVALDFGVPTTMSTIKCRFFKEIGAWIHLPSSVTVEGSNDGATYIKVAENNKISSENKVANVTLPTPSAKYRYLKVTIKNFGPIPEGLPGSGSKPWLFIDEIAVE